MCSQARGDCVLVAYWYKHVYSLYNLVVTNKPWTHECDLTTYVKVDINMFVSSLCFKKKKTVVYFVFLLIAFC